MLQCHRNDDRVLNSVSRNMADTTAVTRLMNVLFKCYVAPEARLGDKHIVCQLERAYHSPCQKATWLQHPLLREQRAAIIIGTGNILAISHEF